LKEWDISFIYGIKTGYNEAFIIDQKKREEILANCKTADECKRTDELLRPILRGKDIKRYGYEWAGRYLIATHNGIPEKGVQRIDVEKYPSIKKYLNTYWEEISTRSDQGDTPYNLRSCAYMDDFSKPKIVWGNLSLSAAFSKAQGGMFINAPSPMIVPFDGYLLAVLNSKLGDWYIRHLGVTRNGGYFEYKPMFIEQLPVPKVQPKTAKALEVLAENPAEENQIEIDRLVFELFGLNKDETLFVSASY
jgi:hypothetical protein